MLFSKKERRLLAVTDGMLIPLSQVKDEAFSAGILGEGFAIEPTAGTIYSPAAGTVESISETKHAYTILTDDGLDILIHVGIDTVEMKGDGFLPMVAQGDRVKAGDVLLRADLDLIKKRGYPTTIPVLITNPEVLKELHVNSAPRVEGGQSNVAEYQIKS
jgi:PTS system beta-glucosides-specific IIC component